MSDCENCPFKKFSEDIADKLAKVMIDNGITDFDEFAKRFECDQCHYYDCAIKTIFCNSCGAKMMKEAENEKQNGN